MKSKIQFKLDEFWPFLNILNEICNGIYIYEFEKKIGVNEEKIRNFKDKARELWNNAEEEHKNEIILCLDISEILFLINCYNVIFKEIEEWEFQTRIGISRNEAEIIRDKLNQLNDNPNSQSIPTKKI